METPLSPKDLSEAAGISPSYASMILNGQRDWTRPIALAVFRRTGSRFGPLVGASDDEIAVLAKFEPRPTTSEIAA